MPTPSSNPPPGPSSLSPYPSTCPDDLIHTSRPQPTRHISSVHPDSMEVQHEPESDTSSPAFTHSSPRDDLATDDALTAEPSSRATTLSPHPRPRSGPTVDADDVDLVKHQESVVGYQLSRENSPSSQRVADRSNESLARDFDESPLSVEDDQFDLPAISPEYSSKRAVAISPSSYLRPGSRFHGTQQSERQVYDVQVEIKHVDMRESFLCGYLRIQGLTEDHPTLTTYFEGEIIGSKYSFFTQHEDWGANTKVDLSHWAKFNAFRPFSKSARKGVTIPDVSQRENIFMRWKEHFLVPDHRVRTISGASFEGFYYICFNQVKGEVSGIYFHSKSEKFQQLELKHVPDRGCFSATEFR